MAKTNVNASMYDQIKTIGMDLVPPYAVYINNVQVAKYETEQEAAMHYERLRLQGERQKSSNKLN